MRARRQRPPREVNVEENSRKLARDRGWVSRKMNGMGFNSWPDRLFIPPKPRGPVQKARLFWVEFKRIGEDLSPDQERLCGELVDRGETVYVCRTKEEFLEALDYQTSSEGRIPRTRV